MGGRSEVGGTGGGREMAAAQLGSKPDPATLGKRGVVVYLYVRLSVLDLCVVEIARKRLAFCEAEIPPFAQRLNRDDSIVRRTGCSTTTTSLTLEGHSDTPCIHNTEQEVAVVEESSGSSSSGQEEANDHMTLFALLTCRTSAHAR